MKGKVIAIVAIVVMLTLLGVVGYNLYYSEDQLYSRCTQSSNLEACRDYKYATKYSEIELRQMSTTDVNTLAARREKVSGIIERLEKEKDVAIDKYNGKVVTNTNSSPSPTPNGNSNVNRIVTQSNSR